MGIIRWIYLEYLLSKGCFFTAKKRLCCTIIVLFLLLSFSISYYNHAGGNYYFGDSYDISAVALQSRLTGHVLEYNGQDCYPDSSVVFTSHSQTRPIYPVLLTLTNILFNNLVVSITAINCPFPSCSL